MVTFDVPPAWAKIREDLEKYLDQAITMTVNMPEDDSVYDTEFIQKKLAKISYYSEMLSDYSLQITKRHIEVSRQASETKALATLSERRLKASEEYAKQPRELKTSWLLTQLTVYRDSEEGWRLTLDILTEVKTTLAERVQMLRRQDSALRLHAKMMEPGRGERVIGSPTLPSTDPEPAASNSAEPPEMPESGIEIQLT